MGSPHEIAKTLLKYDKFLLVTHVMPDGDGIGSMLGLSLGLKQFGKHVTMTCPSKIPETFCFLPGFSEIIPPTEVGLHEYDVLVVLDSSDLGRIEGVYEALPPDLPIINIDHHPTNKGYGTYNYVDSSSSATGEQVYRILISLNVQFDSGIAMSLFTAIATDTGFFKFSNTTADTLYIAAKLIENGAEPSHISECLYDTKSLESLKILGRALGTLQTDKTGKIAWLEVYKDWFDELSLDEGHTEGFVNYARMIKGIEVAFIFKESTDGQIQVGMRSKGELDVSKLAEMLGGGGHKKAAGCSLSDQSIANAKKLVFEKVYEIMGLAGD